VGTGELVLLVPSQEVLQNAIMHAQHFTTSRVCPVACFAGHMETVRPSFSAEYSVPSVPIPCLARSYKRTDVPSFNILCATALERHVQLHHRNSTEMPTRSVHVQHLGAERALTSA
jgi:hypothetical protein